MASSVSALRVLCAVEGVSLLLLFGVAMPLKYVAGRPEAVRIVGMAHGLLWIALCALLLVVIVSRRWSLGRGAAVFLSSLLPFGFLAVDRRLRAWDADSHPPTPTP
ncbi:MAG: DUF3817 domain-containing protein [Planctomycetes bacterium]|nr:DUF3817 domain-containing protein [Planctomycetota bacterium]